MERTDILELMSTLKLYGMRAAYDEVMTTGIKRRHEPSGIVGDLLSAEIAEKQARSIKYQLTIAKLPLAKDIGDFGFTGTPVNEVLIRDLASGAFLAEQRNAVLIGWNRHRQVASGDSYRAGLHPRRRQGPLLYRRRSRQSAGQRSPRQPAGAARPISHAHGLHHSRRARLSALRSDRRPSALSSGQPALRAHFRHHHHQPGLWRLAQCVWRRQDDNRAPRPPDPSLRNHRNRQRELALQAPRLSATPACPGGQTGTSHARRSVAREGTARRAPAPPVRYRDKPAPTPVRSPFSMPIRGPDCLPFDKQPLPPCWSPAR